MLAEEEYNRLKLQNSKLATDDAPAAATNSVVVVEEPSTKLLLTHVDDEPQLPLPLT